VVPFLVEAGEDVIAVDLPGDDETAGLCEYTDVAVDAIRERSDVVLVAGSLGGFESVCDFGSWPAIRTRVLAGEQDRFFPVGFQRRIARDRGTAES
jgi:hypothetical protein